MSEWEYVRTNSKGEPIFRRDTNETKEFVDSFLDERNIPYQYREKPFMYWITNDEGRDYAYFYTTGRWCKRVNRGYPKMHYQSKGIEDFCTRFLNKFVGQPFNKKEENEDNT